MASMFVSPELRERAKAQALARVVQALQLSAPVIRSGSVAGVLQAMTADLAFARVLEQRMLDALRTCPDRELAREVEEGAAGIAAELSRALAADGTVPR